MPSRRSMRCFPTRLPKPADPGGADCATIASCVGAWLSLVEHSVRDRGVGGSNPLAPTTFPLRFNIRSSPAARRACQRRTSSFAACFLLAAVSLPARALGVSGHRQRLAAANRDVWPGAWRLQKNRGAGLHAMSAGIPRSEHTVRPWIVGGGLGWGSRAKSRRGGGAVRGLRAGLQRQRRWFACLAEERERLAVGLPRRGATRGFITDS